MDGADSSLPLLSPPAASSHSVSGFLSFSAASSLLSRNSCVLLQLVAAFTFESQSCHFTYLLGFKKLMAVQKKLIGSKKVIADVEKTKCVKRLLAVKLCDIRRRYILQTCAQDESIISKMEVIRGNSFCSVLIAFERLSDQLK
jgi:hypothetical protein